MLTNAGEPLNEMEAEQMMKEADKDGDGTIDYAGKWHEDTVLKDNIIIEIHIFFLSVF